MDLPQLLPEDVLADILRRVAPRGLAVCRCACKALRASIDASGLLRPDLLPLAVGGIFINFRGTLLSEFFARPSAGPAISGRFDYLPRPDEYPESLDCCSIVDHCNGLLLLDVHEDHYYVVNPATRQWDALPTRPSMFKEADPGFAYQWYLVFDPTLSPHYKVFLIPHPRYKRKTVGYTLGWREYNISDSEDEVDPAMEESEWPPSMCALHIFSSRSGCWEERSFIRQGKAAGTIADMRSSDLYERRYAVYHGGALYVHCKTDFIMRIYLTNDTYEVIKSPMDGELIECRKFRLGRSEKGVSLASLCPFGWFASTSNKYRLQVWVLEESGGHTNWVLKHNNCLRRIMPDDRPVLGSWVLQDINCNEYLKEYKKCNISPDEYVEQLLERKFELMNTAKKTLLEATVEWDSENDDILDNEYMVGGCHDGHMYILGFHPYKEVIFLNVSSYRGLAYHLKDSKVQDLGYLYPTSYHITSKYEQFITESFTYTPCWTGHPEGTRM